MPEAMGPGEELRYQVDFYLSLVALGAIAPDAGADRFCSWTRQQSPVALARAEAQVFSAALSRVLFEAPKPLEYQSRLLAVCWDELKKSMRGAA